MSKTIKWCLFIEDLGLTEEEIKRIANLNSMQPLHEAFIKEVHFRWGDLREKMQIGIGYPEVAEKDLPKKEEK